jgi:hypothetical protein
VIEMLSATLQRYRNQSQESLLSQVTGRVN